MRNNKETPLHVALYPWVAMGHITSYLRIGNKLAQRGHKISMFLPPKTQLRFASQNHHPDLITFIPIALPFVEGLPSGAETTNDVPLEAGFQLIRAFDLTQDTIEAHLINLKPNIVFYDFSYWLPGLARKHGIKSIYYMSGLVVRIAYTLTLVMDQPSGQPITVDRFISPLPSFPSPFIKMKAHEVDSLDVVLPLLERLRKSIMNSDAIGVKTCKEMESVYCEYIENKYGKPVFTAGPVLLDPQVNKLDDGLNQWLSGFEPGHVVYCAFGSECILEIGPFQDLVLGLELTGKPFLAALVPPRGYETIESALPEGFEERTKGKGIVYGGWVQQQLILSHPSVGCFVTHCGVGSLSEAMVNKCQLVLIPHAADQFINARFMNFELKAGVEVEKKDEDGSFTPEAVSKAITTVMDEESQVGREVRANHAKWRDFILKEGVEESYITSFIQDLQKLVG